MLRLEQIDHVALNVSDGQRSVDWYRGVLGLERRREEHFGDRPAFVCEGDTCLALFESDRAAGERAGDAPALRHLAFRVDRAGFEQARSELERRAIELRFADHGISHSVYLSDPDGHTLEITTYELEA